MALDGDLREIAFSDVARLCSRVPQATKLEVSDPETNEPVGVFYFRDGELIDARLGEHLGEQAVLRALELKAGRFRAIEQVESPERRIFRPLARLILVSLRRLDAQARPPTATAPAPTETDLAALIETPPPGEAKRDTRHDEESTVRERKAPLVPLAPLVAPPPFSPWRSRLHRWQETVAREASRLARLARGSLARRGLSPVRREVALGLGLAVGLLLIVGTVMLIRGPKEQKQALPARPAPVVTRPAPPPPSPRVRTKGVTDAEVVFGLVAPFSGPSRELGQQMKTGIEAAFHGANEAGGIAGRRLRLEVRDDAQDATRTLTAMRELDEKAGVLGILGTIGTANAIVASPFAADRQMLFLGGPSGSSMLRRQPPERYAFNVRASTVDEAVALARHILKNRRLRAKQIAIVNLTSPVESGGEAAVLEALRAMPALGPASFLRFPADQPPTEGIQEAAARLYHRRVWLRAVLLIGPPEAAAALVARTKAKHPSTLFAVVASPGFPDLSTELRRWPARLVAGTVSSHVVPSARGPSAAATAYRAALAAVAPDEPPRELSFESYLTAQVLLQGLARAGRALDSETLVAALETLHENQTSLEVPITFSADDHQAWHRVWATRMEKGHRERPIDLD